MKVPKRPPAKWLICAASALFAVVSVAAQQLGTPFPPFKTQTSHIDLAPDLQLDIAPLQMKTPIFSPHWRPAPFGSEKAGEMLTIMAVVNNYANSPTPFFCRIEENIEKSARFPVRIRLGDINYVNRLEQKRDWELGN